MPFGLRNARATYQRLVDKAFHKQIGRNLEVSEDDLVIKSHTKDEIVRDIEETFKTLREFNMKLNPKKCTFGVEEGMFLGYKINTKGLKVCPNKKSDFHWTAKAEEAFKQMKQLIAEIPMLTAPTEIEELIVYLAAAKETVSAVLMTKKEAKQMPIYFVSRALRGPELNYTSMEKLVLSRPKVKGRLQKWSIELGEYAIHYRPRVSVKGKILADGSGAGLILTNPEGVEFTYTLRFRFDATNNEAEYEALIARLRIAKQMGVKNLQANVDSRFVANQVNGTYVAKEVDMICYLKKTNGLVERANRSLGEGIKARLDARCKNWMEELPHVLWAHHTMIKSSNGDTPFSLTYGTEVVIPVKIGMPTLRTAELDMVQNNKALEIRFL
nr:retrovirus-related Pol polyprotein from transposon 17.6 [Tanacetum cinerariifolium]